MKIAIIGPGIMPIPPKGWGAVESLIWDYYTELVKKGHDVKIINSSDNLEIINSTNNFNPDFVHMQYDDYAHLMRYITCPFKAITSHYGYIEQYDRHPEYNHILHNFIHGDFLIFCLSEGIKNTYIKLGVDPKKLYVTPNGARRDTFLYKKNPDHSDRSIYLAKIDYRKRQHIYQDINNLFFAGNCVDSKFNTNSSQYLGEWSKDFLYNNLTNYANLVLLSDGEADPLVTKEALMAGLGLVISEYSIANLDLSLPFISVVKNEYLDNIDYIKQVIDENRIISLSMRESIRNYALSYHSWDIIVDKYINTIQNIIK